MNFEFDKDDEKLEAQLRQFRPQTPRPLPGRVLPTPSRRRFQFALLGSVAAILLAVIFVVRPGKWKREDTPPVARQVSIEPVTLGQLRRLTDDPAQLDAQLDSLSRVLPDVRRIGGVLSKLAQESH
jgi:hypothetical protein